MTEVAGRSGEGSHAHKVPEINKAILIRQLADWMT